MKPAGLSSNPNGSVLVSPSAVRMQFVLLAAYKTIKYRARVHWTLAYQVRCMLADLPCSAWSESLGSSPALARARDASALHLTCDVGFGYALWTLLYCACLISSCLGNQRCPCIFCRWSGRESCRRNGAPPQHRHLHGGIAGNRLRWAA